MSVAPLVDETPTPVDTAVVEKVTGCEQYRPIVSQYSWNADIAMAIMQAESGCNPSAYNGTNNADGSDDAGLFQINSIHVKSGLIADEARYDPDKNIEAAHSVYLGSGWSAWSVYNNGRYQKYL